MKKRTSKKTTVVDHAEWLSLLDVSGPFLLPAVLQRVFPQGLDAHDAEHAALLRGAYAEWLDGCDDPAIHRAWTRFVLRRTLGFPKSLLLEAAGVPASCSARIDAQHETLTPDFAVVTPAGRPDAGTPRLLVQVVAPEQDLDKPLAGAHWKASPGLRMVELLHGTGVRLGLVTNGERWMLVQAPRGETSGFASWWASLWSEEPLTLRAFRSLLSARRFFGVPDAETIEALLAESARDQQEVTEQLGIQVRRAVELLVQRLDRLDKDRRRRLLRGVEPKHLYEAAVSVMMRLVFLFSAEERGLLPLDDPFYAQHYAVSPLRDQLREAADRHGEDVLERRHAAWARLLATFRAVHGGVSHDLMRLPAYGGSLFDPDRFPFLEGRPVGSRWRDVPADPLHVDDRTVLYLLEAMQLLRAKGADGAVGARRLSFKALDIEQIGHVYESLLDHTAERAERAMVSLVGRAGDEPEVPLEELEALRRKPDRLVEMVREHTGRSESAVRKSLAYEIPDDDEDRLLVDCGNDTELYGRVRKFAGLVREDAFGRRVVIEPGSVYVTQGADRRSTGTHYTPRSLTEPMVRHALEPLVYEGPAEGWPEERWTLRSPREILDLKICDPAMGSGAFLVQACRWLAERLVESWERVEAAHPGMVLVSPEGEVAGGTPRERAIPKDVDERLALARRLIVDRCLYGVDKNELAVEMAKLSLWLITLQKDKPFTFVDHALRCGDSLLGVTALEQIELFHLRPAGGLTTQIPLFAKLARAAAARALEKRRELESFIVNDVRDAEHKAQLLAEADAAVDEVKLIGDLIVGAALASGAAGKPFEDALADEAAALKTAFESSADRDARVVRLRRRARTLLDHARPAEQLERRCLHWALEFPEVFAAGGFSAMLGNPPFLGGQHITGTLGTDYRELLVEAIADGKRGSADLCAYFFLRAASLLREGGGFAMLATNTIAQGDTREAGLEQLERRGFTFPRAVRSRKWPGDANLEVAQVWVRRGTWQGQPLLDDEPVRAINALLAVPGRVQGKPYRLPENDGKSFQGSIVLGMGFVLTPEEAQALIRKEKRNRQVLFPYLNGEDLNSRPDQSPSRWVINFHDWPLDRKTAPKGYDGPVAADFPDCLKIVREKVKPERDRNKRAIRRMRWWQFAERAPGLYAAIQKAERVLARARVSEFHLLAFVPTSMVASEATVIFPFEDQASFALLQSSIHELWAREYSSSLETRMRYAPSDCFETFPFPESWGDLRTVGAEYYDLRAQVMRSNQQGLTLTQNRIHDPDDRDPRIARLRSLLSEMDHAVIRSYGWKGLSVNHRFRDTPSGVRFGISPVACREILDRLLELNHSRAAGQGIAEEWLLGRSQRGARARRTRGAGDLEAQPGLFD